MKRIFVMLALCLLLTAPAMAAKHTHTETGAQAHKSKVPDIHALTDRANAGDAKAQVKLGNIYAAGNHVVKDMARAAAWYRKAADQGNAQAERNLGELYVKGEGVPRDEEIADQLFESAAGQGLAAGQTSLGNLYAHGQGVRFRDDAEAAKWWRLAADQNDGEAQKSLGELYFNGLGVQQSYEEADFWYRLSASHKLGKGAQKKLQASIAATERLLQPLALESVEKRVLEWKPVVPDKTPPATVKP